MKRFDLWKLSLLNVFSCPVRSILTVLGFAIGVAAILAVLTLGKAGREQVQSEMNRLGIDRIWVSSQGERSLARGTGEWLTERIGSEAHELVYLPVIIRSESGKEAEATIIGCDQGYLKDVCLKEGRMFWPMEWKRPTQHILLGEEVAQALGIASGHFVTIEQKVYEVCGILGEHEGVISVPLESAALLPLDSLLSITGNTIHEIQLSINGNTSLQNAQKKAEYLLETQGYAAKAVTMEIQMEAASSVINTFVNVLKWVAMVCILVGGVGVMNILLVSVRERKREIGIMKSMGTTPCQVCILFLLEAMVYAVIGGLLGILMGMGLIAAAGRSIDLAAQAGWADCLTVFFCALFVGIFFGVTPAFRASRLTCVDALRQE